MAPPPEYRAYVGRAMVLEAPAGRFKSAADLVVYLRLVPTYDSKIIKVKTYNGSVIITTHLPRPRGTK